VIATARAFARRRISAKLRGFLYSETGQKIARGVSSISACRWNKRAGALIFLFAEHILSSNYHFAGKESVL
jgi:hypothetical protein